MDFYNMTRQLFFCFQCILISHEYYYISIVKHIDRCLSTIKFTSIQSPVYLSIYCSLIHLLSNELHRTVHVCLWWDRVGFEPQGLIRVESLVIQIAAHFISFLEQPFKHYKDSNYFCLLYSHHQPTTLLASYKTESLLQVSSSQIASPTDAQFGPVCSQQLNSQAKIYNTDLLVEMMVLSLELSSQINNVSVIIGVIHKSADHRRDYFLPYYA